MTKEGTERAMVSARRCLAAAVEQVEMRDFKTAGALFRAAGRYMDEIREGKDDDAGELVSFPLAHACATGGAVRGGATRVFG